MELGMGTARGEALTNAQSAIKPVLKPRPLHILRRQVESNDWQEDIQSACCSCNWRCPMWEKTSWFALLAVNSKQFYFTNVFGDFNAILNYKCACAVCVCGF